jgi:large subunit ribosomal protein L15
MKANELIKNKLKPKKRLGRGESSGKGKTAGRGAKGQKKRGKVKPGFEGGQLPIYKRLPQKRGTGNTPKNKPLTIVAGRLDALSASKIIDRKVLQEAGLIPKSKKGIKVKVVSGGKLEKKLKVDLPTTKAAKTQIEKVGGEVVYEDSK